MALRLRIPDAQFAVARDHGPACATGAIGGRPRPRHLAGIDVDLVPGKALRLSGAR